MSNTSLNASKAKMDNDDYYTYYEDINKELVHYFDQLNGKIIYCNCDNPYKSQFVKYFVDNFEKIGIKRLIATSKEKEHGLYLDIDRIEYTTSRMECIANNTTHLNGDGSFESDECIKLMEQCDVVITNPPFSLFRLWYKLVRSLKKDILVIANLNAILYQEVIGDTVNNRLNCGYTARNGHRFWTDSGDIKKLGYTCWMTTLIVADNPPIATTATDIQYKTYDTYPDAIEISKLKYLPSDYHGLMGVPITFWLKYCKNQFRIVGKADQVRVDRYNLFYPIIDGKRIYKRMLIERI